MPTKDNGLHCIYTVKLSTIQGTFLTNMSFKTNRIVLLLNLWDISRNWQINSYRKTEIYYQCHTDSAYLWIIKYCWMISPNTFTINKTYLTLLSLSNSFLNHSKSLYRRLTLDSLTLNTGKFVCKQKKLA